MNELLRQLNTTYNLYMTDISSNSDSQSSDDDKVGDDVHMYKAFIDKGVDELELTEGQRLGYFSSFSKTQLGKSRLEHYFF